MSSKINLQTCEYACKSSIFQDNQLIWIETLDRFCKADCAVAAEAEEWVREHVYQADRVAMLAPASFEKMEAELRNLAGMRSMGLDDVELVHVT